VPGEKENEKIRQRLKGAHKSESGEKNTNHRPSERKEREKKKGMVFMVEVFKAG